MLADQLDYVVGVDPHRDSHALAVVHVVSGAVLFEANIAASSSGYARALKLVDQHAAGRRAFAVEGAGSFGAGLTRFLTGHGERVLEIGRLRRERRSGGKTDALDAIRAARSMLAPGYAARRWRTRSIAGADGRAGRGGERKACRPLPASRLLVTTPEPLRSELRPLTRAHLLQRLAATRPARRPDPELRGALLALRFVARRVLQLTTEERELAREIETITRRLAPQLLQQPGVGPLAAGTFDNGFETFVDHDVCAPTPWGFDVSVVQHEYGFFDLFFNQDGSFAKLLAHQNYDATISANGKTIVERDTWQFTFYPDGTSRITGSTVHIQGPGGIAVRDAGQVVFNADGTVNFSHGPHAQLIDNVSFCPALAP